MCQNLISTSSLDETGMVILGGAWGSQKCWTIMMLWGGGYPGHEYQTKGAF